MRVQLNIQQRDFAMGVRVRRGTVRSDFINLSQVSEDWTIVGFAGNDVLISGNGNDKSYGGVGNDTLAGNGGNDLLIGGIGNDFLAGDDGKDSLYGGEGNDTLIGGLGVDSLLGGEGDDLLDCRSAPYLEIGDILVGGLGNDTILGSSGSDQIVVTAGVDLIRCFEGNDVITFAGGSAEVNGGGGSDLYVITAKNFVANITDFASYNPIYSSDRVDLSKLDADENKIGHQSFRIAPRFSMGTAGLLIVNTIGQWSQVLGDINGDTRADFVISLKCVRGFDRAQDLIL